MKKGFTFAELMISLVVIAVITAILYPTIAELAPNNNKHLFKSAYKTLEMVISEVVNDPNASPNGIIGEQELCINIASKLNTKGATPDKVLCAKAYPVDAANPSFVTTNGMRWFVSHKSGNKFTITVDVNASNNNVGGGYHPDEDAYSQDTFTITVLDTGKIETITGAGYNHLTDSSPD